MYNSRARNGWNNNPSALQFMRTFRKLILHANISERGGSCQVIDTTSVLSVTIGQHTQNKNIDIANIRKQAIEYEAFTKDHNYDVALHHITISEFCDNVVNYMGGYVLKMMARTIYCEECLDLLVLKDLNMENAKSKLIRRRDLGNFLVIFF